MAAVDMASSAFSGPLPPAGPPPEDGLGYSRHYAQKIRDMGRSSKESWIKKLWNHMFKKKDEPNKSAPPGSLSESGKTQNRGKNVLTLPPIKGLTSTPRDGQGSSRDGGTRSAPMPRGQKKLQTLPVQLADSPYLPARERSKYTIVPNSDRSSHREQTKAEMKSHRGDQRDLNYNDTRPKRKEPPYHKEHHGSGKNLSYVKSSDPSPFMKRTSHPYLSSHHDSWKPKQTRGVSTINMEKRAKAAAEKAIKEAKVFSCEGPYPLDAFVRWSLRKRGWVEKFGQRGNSSSSRSQSGKLACENDEDFEAICEQEVPAPWEEEHGLYAMISRCCRHYPAKFIWGGRAVNSLVLRSEVIVNHFPKARYFSSKVLLTASLRELPWTNNADSHAFFPRCYLLNEDERDDFVEDFRLTACMSMLRWVLRVYTNENLADRAVIIRENTKYIEVTSSKDEGDDVQKAGLQREKSIFDTETRQRLAAEDDEEEDAEDEEVERKSRRKSNKSTSRSRSRSRSKSRSESEKDKDDSCRDTSDAKDNTVKSSSKSSLSSRKGTNKSKEDVTIDDLHGDGLLEDKDIDSGVDAGTDDGEEKASKETEYNPKGEPKVMPEIKPQIKPTKKTEVPVKAVEWALQSLERYLRFKTHEDLDVRKRGLTSAQWDQLTEWCHKLVSGTATIPITEGKLRECEEILKKLKKYWAQIDVDGERNIWILKPGDKSKGIGIEFINKLEEALKYIDNSTTQGNYVIQKYIERPLLVYNCKFDVRQWFLVTDWNPLTMWFYKDSYLRICSQEYSYDSMHESVHLSNVAVQQNYLNGKRSDKLPDNNFMVSDDFKKYLADMGHPDAWDDIIYPGMKESIINTLVATQDVPETRRSAFELYGADFMYTEDFKPMLLEINSSPGMAPSSVEKAKLCARVIDDAIKVVLDRREHRGCDTGRFEMAYREIPLQNSKCVETKFLLEGQRIRKPDLQRYTLLDQRVTKQDKDKAEKAKRKEMEKNAPPNEDKKDKEGNSGKEEGLKEEKKVYDVKKIEEKVKGESESSGKSEPAESVKKVAEEDDSRA